MRLLTLLTTALLLSSCAVTTIENRYEIAGSGNTLTCPSTAGAEKRSATDFGLSAAASRSGLATNSGGGR